MITFTYPSLFIDPYWFNFLIFPMTKLDPYPELDQFFDTEERKPQYTLKKPTRVSLLDHENKKDPIWEKIIRLNGSKS